ncbi:MAG TPA: two-component system response regulator [Paenibacillus sp.]|uniref:response regulator transcription factor n=1 Tax=Paenibacillus TaxID=44249 RepID=UPI000BA15A43|nr:MULTISPECIES: response regulator [Paenibacillus]OZQ74021.1 two-component system response regulator [Paenibacillus taichungensis]HBU82875.1 two-component system response regulator [Paenibacillus sp.]
MYNIMIVEDSKPILRNIKMLLDKLNFPIHVAVTATNGKEALAVLQKETIDLLLTDIRMPKMDGLSLIEQAKLAQPELKVILISGYSDFEYTRKALNLQVFDYLLKPVEPEALEEVMGRVIKELDQLRSRNVHQLQEIVDSHSYAELKPGENFTFFAQMMIIIRRQPFTPERERWGQRTLQASLEDFFAPRSCKVFQSQTPHQFIVFVNKGIVDLYSSVHECLESLRRHLVVQGMDTIIGGQVVGSETVNFPELYYQISSILSTHQRLNHGLVLDSGKPVSMARSEAGSLNSILELDFVHMIQAHQKERFALKLSELMNRWTKENVHVKEVERFINLVVDTFAHLNEEQGAGIRLGLDLRAKKLFDKETYADFCRELTEWIGQCFEMLQSHERKSREVLFEQMDEYIKRNKYTPISINDIAMKFHVSPSYVSRVIKNVTQVTFVQYYTNLRIKEACRLMACQPEMKFKELSDLLSFSDQHYFSKVFKEYTGLSPTEYKERLLK